MRERPEVWLLAPGEELVAGLEVERLDPPWFCGRVVRRPGNTKPTSSAHTHTDDRRRGRQRLDR